MAISSTRRGYDVIVVGLGGMGSAAAYRLARRGQRVLGLERFTSAHDRGSSHGGSRIIRLAYFEDPAYVPLLQRAYELWRLLERDSGRELLTVTGGLLLGPPASPTIAGAARSAAQFGLAHELLDAPDIRRRFPTLAPDDDTVAFFEDTAGLVRPEATVAAHLELATAAGADCRFSEPVLGWEAAPGGTSVTVRTSAATYSAGRLVICPGAYTADLFDQADIRVTAQRQVQTWFDPSGGLEPFLPDRHPVWMWEPREGTELAGFHGFVYGLPAVDGPAGGVKISVIADSPSTTPETIERRIGAAELDLVTAQVRRCLAVPSGPVLRADTCIFETSSDNHFLIGSHPRHAQVIVAAGFSGHGFKFVPVVGEILADLAIDGVTPHPISLFDPRRHVQPLVISAGAACAVAPHQQP